jgi:pimeloyl-ACP methyl ester carboxylesterase
MTATLPFATERQAWGDPEAPNRLLALHPLGQSGRFYEGLATLLGPNWHVISYDQRGHGAAARCVAERFDQLVADSEAMLETVPSGAVHLLGHSMGGAVAGELAARAPSGRVTRLTLAAVPARGLPVYAARAAAVSGGGLEAVMGATILRWFGSGLDKPEVTRARAELTRMTPESFDAAWRALAQFRGFAPLAEALPPTLCLSFSDDLSTPPAVLDEIAAVLLAKGVPVNRVDIPGAGHMGFLQKPREVADAILNHHER